MYVQEVIMEDKKVTVSFLIETEDSFKTRTAKVDFTKEFLDGTLTHKHARHVLELCVISITRALQKMKLVKPYMDEEGNFLDGNGNVRETTEEDCW